MSSIPFAAQFMRRSLVTLAPETELLSAVSRLMREDISGAPVIGEDGAYLGVLSEKCCITALTEFAEVAGEVGLQVVRVREFMTCDLVTLSPSMCVFDAIDHILSRRISGAPVCDDEGRYLGIFSEKTAMRVLAAAMHDGLPGTHVGAYMNVDRNRIIDESDLLIDVAHKFQLTPYRRLPVLDGAKLSGQVSRRDVLRAEHRLANEVLANARTRSMAGTASDRLEAVAEPKSVGQYMDQAAMTVPSSVDMLGVTQAFLNSPYRRLPVVDGGRLVGQVSRRDLLQAAADFMRPKRTRGGAETLYLSLVSASAPPSIG